MTLRTSAVVQLLLVLPVGRLHSSRHGGFTSAWRRQSQCRYLLLRLGHHRTFVAVHSSGYCSAHSRQGRRGYLFPDARVRQGKHTQIDAKKVACSAGIHCLLLRHCPALIVYRL